MIATGMSEREEGMGGGGMRFGREKSRLLHTHTRTHTRARTHTHAHTHAHTRSLPSINSQDTGKASEAGKASVNGHEAQERTLQEQGRRRKESWKEGRDHGRELSLALGAGKTLCGSQGWRPSEASRQVVRTSCLKGGA